MLNEEGDAVTMCAKPYAAAIHVANVTGIYSGCSGIHEESVIELP